MKIALELLDSAQGHPIHVWRFDGPSVVRIGRADDNDVTVADPRVSRLHAELRHDAGGWRLVSRGRNPVQADGADVTELALADGVTFRLCAQGPVMRFQEEVITGGSTVSVDAGEALLLEMLTVDERRKEAEVRQITSGELFRRLKERADEMRRRGASRP